MPACAATSSVFLTVHRVERDDAADSDAKFSQQRLCGWDFVGFLPRAAQAICAHWAIETTSHYSRDVTLGEDRSRIRTNPGVFARLRSFAFNILKANRSSTLSQERYRAAFAGFDRLSKLIRV